MGSSFPSLGEVGKGIQLVSLLFCVREWRAALHFEVSCEITNQVLWQRGEANAEYAEVATHSEENPLM